MEPSKLEQMIRDGESETVEFKKSTAQLRRAMETLCSMLNGNGGRVLVGVTPEGRVVGQMVSDKTLREIADALRHFEPLRPLRRHASTSAMAKKCWCWRRSRIRPSALTSLTAGLISGWVPPHP